MHGRLRVGWRQVDGRLEAVWHDGPPQATGAAVPPRPHHERYEMTNGRINDPATPGFGGGLAFAAPSGPIDRGGAVPGVDVPGW